MHFPVESRRPHLWRAAKMPSSPIRRVALPCAGLLLLLGGFAGADATRPTYRVSGEFVESTAPLAGHSEEPQGPAIRPVAYTSVPQLGPAAEPSSFPRLGTYVVRLPQVPEGPGPNAVGAAFPASGMSPSPELPITLPSALAAVSGNNPEVAYANARIADPSPWPRPPGCFGSPRSTPV